ncbi:transmembrane protein 183 [Topomyia yanbarensis]|uniref:transmembrane protein 183 n=1 Tax=Topomyia yanbarensis TaxID=2498891 RepID=UPI00273CCE2A|nr:transmembrane protein 183 [Topomyia yanbarensis]
MTSSFKVKSSRNWGTKNDFSIYDFADAKTTNKVARLPKCNKLLVDGANENELDPLEDDAGQSLTRASPSDGTSDETTEIGNIPYADYVIDIWYLISEHVRPEDVCRFALICRKTYTVVQSAKFWQHIYQKHYDSSVELPRRLQPDCMSLLRGLRACTIRSLFYTYPPFVHRISTAALTNPHRITGRQLLFSWYCKNKTGWNYCFKLKARLIPGSRAARSSKMQQLKQSLDYLQDSYMNFEEGCQILIITTDSLHTLPQYHEQLYVGSLTQTLDQGMRNYKVRLQMVNYCRRVVDELVFVPVRQLRVLDWWVPEYGRVDPTIEQQAVVDIVGDSMNDTVWDDL